MNSDFITRSKHQRKVNEKISLCLTCERKCKIPIGKSGFCQTRINDNGEIVGVHRKLVPTFIEKLIYSRGDGSYFDVY